MREHMLRRPLTFFTSIPNKLNSLATAYNRLPEVHRQEPGEQQCVALVQAQLASTLNWWQHERDIPSLDTISGGQVSSSGPLDATTSCSVGAVTWL